MARSSRSLRDKNPGIIPCVEAPGAYICPLADHEAIREACEYIKEALWDDVVRELDRTDTAFLSAYSVAEVTEAKEAFYRTLRNQSDTSASSR